MSVVGETTQAHVEATALHPPAVDVKAPSAREAVAVVEQAAPVQAPADADWSAPSLILAVAALAVWRLVRGRR